MPFAADPRPLVQYARHRQAIKPADEVALHREGRGTGEVRRDHRVQQHRVSDNQRGTDHNPRRPAEMHVSERGEHPCDADLAENAPVPKIHEPLREYAVAHPAKRNENRGAAKNPQMNLRRRHPPLHLLRIGKREGHSGDEDERGEDHVVERESKPFRMGHLLRQPSSFAAVDALPDRLDHSGKAHDHHHVKSAKRVKRHEPARGALAGSTGRLSFGCHFLCHGFTPFP